MIYVQRNSNGAISGLYENLQPGFAEEQLELDNPEVVNFFNSINSDLGQINYKALIRRIASELITQGNQYDALILLKTIGE